MIWEESSILVTATWLIPALTALALLAVPRDNTLLPKWFSLVGASANLLLAAGLCVRFLSLESQSGPVTGTLTRLRFAYKTPWMESLNIHYHVGVDGISLLMMLLAAVVVFCGVLASWRMAHRPRLFFALMNILAAGVFGSFISFDLFTFFVFNELTLIPTYLLIGIFGSGRKEYAAMKLTLMLVGASALILTGILALYFASGIRSFDILELSQIRLDRDFQYWAFPLLFLGFGILGAIFPFHTWSPDGHSSAPTAISMLLAGVHMKLGGYGCLRVAMYLLPEGASFWMESFLVLATVSVVWGAFVALRQTDLKYINAYSSVSHCGLVLFGYAALNFIAIKGAVLQMLAHGLMTALFFCLIGMIYSRTHTRLVAGMRGLMATMPFLSTALVITGFAALGLPGLAGFVAEATIFIGGFARTGVLYRVCTVLCVLSIAVTAVYVLRAVNAVVNGPSREGQAALSDASSLEKVPVVLLLSCILGMGIYPGWMIEMIDKAIAPIVGNLSR